MSQVARVWFFTLVLLIGLSGETLKKTNAQSAEADWVIGIWENLDISDIGVHLLGIAFLPDGQIRFAEYEGMTYGEYFWIDERHISLNLISPPGYGRGFIRTNGIVVEISLQDEYLTWSRSNAFGLQTGTFRKIHDFNAGNQNHCPNTLPSRLVKDFFGYVTYTDGTPTRLRTQPSVTSSVLVAVAEGTRFLVTGGPSCADGYTWWKVVLKDTHEIGWMAEGSDYYFTDLYPISADAVRALPFGASQPDLAAINGHCLGALSPRMVVNRVGRVTFTDGSSTNLRSGPASSNVLLAMPEGYEFEVIGGPECHNGLNWWKLRTPDGVVGWAPEGANGAEYWIEPLPIQRNDDSQPVSLNTKNCQNEPYIGMRFVWYELDLASNIGVRAWPTAEAALQSGDAAYIETSSGRVSMSGTIDTLSWDFPSAIIARDFTNAHQVLDGPVCEDSRCAWLVTLYDGFGWVNWHEDFCEWRYGELPWQEGDALTVNAEPFSRIPIFYGDPVPGTDVGMLGNGTDVSVVEGPVTNTGWYLQWFDLQAPVTPDPSVYGYRWWYVRLSNGTTGYVPEGLPMAGPWLKKSSVPMQNENFSTQLVTVYNPLWDMNYDFEVDLSTCLILNGAEIVSTELSLFTSWLQTSRDSLDRTHMAYAYLRPAIPLQPRGYVEEFRENAERALGEVNCADARFQIGSRSMDLSGIGNIAFGFYAERYDLSWESEESTSNWEQGINPRSFLQFYDNDDDLVQRLLGHALATRVGSNSISESTLVTTATSFNLR